MKTTAELPITTAQRRIYDACTAAPDKPRAAIARELGISRKRVQQAMAVVRTKHLHQGATSLAR